MRNIKKINKLSIYLVVIAILISILGFTYAYFTANITGAETSTTITTTGGTMNIIYNGGANINLANIYPKDEVWEIKNFTVTGNNTTGLDMFYNISLNIVSNTFSDRTLKYKLISTNSDGYGTIVPSKTSLEDIPSGANDIILNGALTYPIGLLTTDETALTGIKSTEENLSNYLYAGYTWWTIGPSRFFGGNANMWTIYSTGHMYNGSDSNKYGVRGVINLKSNTKVLGTGTIYDPYKVI